MDWEKEYKLNNLRYNQKSVEYPLLDYLPLLKGKKVLDVGCGNSFTTKYLIRKKYQVTCLDISESILSILAEEMKSYNLNFNLINKDILHFDFEDQKFDLIILSSILNFFDSDSIDKIIRASLNHLNPKGLIFFKAFNINENSRKLFKSKNILEFEKNTFNYKNNKFHYFTKNEVIKLFKKTEILYLNSQQKMDLSHGKPHYHNSIVLLGIKK